MQQVRIQLILRVSDGCNAIAYRGDLKTLFLESYFNKDEWFQMSVQGLGTPTWHLQGRAKLVKVIHHRVVRNQIKLIITDVFKKCNEKLGFSPPVILVVN